MTSYKSKAFILQKDLTNWVIQINEEEDALKAQVKAIELLTIYHPNLLVDSAQGKRRVLLKRLDEISKERKGKIQKFQEETTQLARSFNVIKIYKASTALVVAEYRDFQDMNETLDQISRTFKNSPNAGGYEILVSLEEGEDDDYKFHSGKANAFEVLLEKINDGMLIPVKE